MMNKKDIKEYHKMIKKLEEQMKEKKEESYKESVKQRNGMIKKVGKIKS